MQACKFICMLESECAKNLVAKRRREFRASAEEEKRACGISSKKISVEWKEREEEWRDTNK